MTWGVVAIAGVLGLATPLLVRPLLRRYGVADDPNERSSHRERTLRGGGVAPLLAIGVGYLLVLALGNTAAVGTVLLLAGAAVAAGLLGLAEDVRGLPVMVRASLQLVIGIGAAAGLCIAFGQQWWAAALGALLIAAYINIANFMDGLNGISGLHGLLSGMVYGALGAFSGSAWLTATGIVVAVAFASFLPWNLTRPGLFLGDVGSYVLGASLASLAVASAMSGISLVTALAPLAIYLADTLVTLARRAARGEPVLRPHRTHAYQRLTDTGLSHVQASLTVSVFSLGAAIVGVLIPLAGLNQWAGAAVIVAIAVVYLLLPRLRGSRLPRKPQTALVDIDRPAAIAPRVDFYPKRWIVLGASGFVGSAVADHLVAAGHDVVRLTAPRLALMPETAANPISVERALNSDDFDALVRAFEGSDVVINAAGRATPDSPADADLYGANALLPAFVARAASSAGVARAIHLSSAAVQGRRSTLDESLDTSPFSPYSHSKALGERLFLSFGSPDGETDHVVIRATSVQGPGRATTESFRHIARSFVASVAAPGNQPTVVSSIDGLVDFVTRVGGSSGPLGPIMLQPWEGHSAYDVLSAAGGSPRILPRWICTMVLVVVRGLGRVIPEVAGAGRRLELMWLGQDQRSEYTLEFPAMPNHVLVGILSNREDAS
ncbi:NAD-dependent epimerase/dehydratase family protein [Microbacterium sp.]|uniref:NAD-dependent epimerase/dehydratase family protein n=1 Tax=Microbacterium sp. TaxID=51671 RepID=UPI002B88186A|nr:NAD-dependent epimerase/dehydratase family protein [Microbacterium sp.]HWK76517.1 NAD-dependent epimerase/dehydratase family protein [Microbacterium sp.]